MLNSFSSVDLGGAFIVVKEFVSYQFYVRYILHPRVEQRGAYAEASQEPS